MSLAVKAKLLLDQVAVLEDQLTPQPTVDPGQILAPANLPESPSSPSYLLNVAVALFVGLALGLGWAFLRERLDERLRYRTDLEQRLDAPVLAVIPKIRDWKDRAQTNLVTAERPVRWHRIRNDQLYHRYLGDALEVLALYPDGTHRLHVVGEDLGAGELLQLPLPGGTFHAARLRAGGRWFLGASTEWPGVEPPDVETAAASELTARFPRAASLITDFLRE